MKTASVLLSRKGANAIEVDVTFARDGNPLYTFHGRPCDCLRHCNRQENFGEYLRYVREIAIDEPDGMGKNLSLLFLDLKLDPLDQRAKARAGIELAKSITSNLFTDLQQSSVAQSEVKPLRLIISINHVYDVDLVYNFLHFIESSNSTHLLERIGFDVGMNDNLQHIELMWKRFGNSINLWQGDGYTNCISPFYKLERLSKAISKRDQETGYPRKVYQWTIDLHDRMREALRMGVDALMTNHPERLLTVLNEPEMVHNFRLATRDDDPFKKIIVRPSQRAHELARHQRSASQTSGGFFGSLMDVIASFIAYIRETLPATSRLIPKVKRMYKQSNSSIIYSSLATNAPAEFRSPPEFSTTSDTTNATTMSTTAVTTTTTMITTTNSSVETTNQTTIGESSPSLGETVDRVLVSPNQIEKPPYEGPKWYTSLATNFLVSVMKIIFPSVLE